MKVRILTRDQRPGGPGPSDETLEVASGKLTITTNEPDGYLNTHVLRERSFELSDLDSVEVVEHLPAVVQGPSAETVEAEFDTSVYSSTGQLVGEQKILKMQIAPGSLPKGKPPYPGSPNAALAHKLAAKTTKTTTTRKVA